MLYKGVAPGTYWHVNDARLSGFKCPGNVNASTNFVVGHITAYPKHSPYTSFSTSYAVALDYALAGGPGGKATHATPAYVYVIDLTQLGSGGNFTLFDPVAELAVNSGNLAHQHDGNPDLIAEIARGANPYSDTTQRGGGKRQPTRTATLLALVNAIRDAEVLVNGNLPSGAVVGRDLVY